MYMYIYIYKYLAACAALFVARPEHALQLLAGNPASAANHMGASGMQREVLLHAGACWRLLVCTRRIRG